MLGTLLSAMAMAAVLQPVPLRVAMGEESDEQTLVDACHLPAAELVLQTRSNMLATGVVDALRRCPRAMIELRVPLLPAHRERLEKVSRAGLLLSLGESDPIDARTLVGLGPRRLHVRVLGPLTEARAQSLSHLRDVELELDLRSRTPDAEELARFRALTHADRWVRIGASTPPELVAALAVVKPSGLVVESEHNALPPALQEALVQSGLPTRVVLRWPFAEGQVAALEPLPHLSLQLELGTMDHLPRTLLPALAPLEPSRALPPPQPLTEPEAPHR